MQAGCRGTLIAQSGAAAARAVMQGESLSRMQHRETSHDALPGRRSALKLLAGAAAIAASGLPSPRPARAAATKIRVLTNFFAEPSAGGYFQAKATGLYDKAGLDVDVRPGGAADQRHAAADGRRDGYPHERRDLRPQQASSTVRRW